MACAAEGAALQMLPAAADVVCVAFSTQMDDWRINLIAGRGETFPWHAVLKDPNWVFATGFEDRFGLLPSKQGQLEHPLVINSVLRPCVQNSKRPACSMLDAGRG